MNGSTVEERLVRLETKWDDYMNREDSVHTEILNCIQSLDLKLDGLLLREAGREGEKREQRSISAKVSGLVSLIVAAVISVIASVFKW
jgi:hypothetical protein